MLEINNRLIGEGAPTYIIAEMGINHNGNVDTAMEMVKAASDSGVDAVKVQIVNADESYVKSSESYSIFKKVELAFKEWEHLVGYANQLKLSIFASFAQPVDVDLIEQLDLPAIKISSSNLTNYPLMEALAQLNKPILISTGLSYLSEVDEAVRFLEDCGQRALGILQCTALYPAQPSDIHLRGIQTICQAFPNYPVGFSDHTLGNTCAIAAVALGARILEKHFTLNTQMKGHDHHFSATPEELKALVNAVREVESALGSPTKRPVTAELPLRDSLQRSLVAKTKIKMGEVYTKENVAIKRSNLKGLPSRFCELLLGRTAKKDLQEDEPITWEVF